MATPKLKLSRHLCLTIYFVVILCKIVSTQTNVKISPGLKFLVNGDLLSFDSSLCPGGVFFKEPVTIPLTCSHGYFLARPSGCSMKESRVFSGEKYGCHYRNENKNRLIQAFIPLTNPDHPLDHTITLYDDPGTLENFRRYTVDQIKAGKYEQSASEPAGVIVANSQKMSKVVNIDKLCYNGKPRESAVSYMATLQKPKDKTDNDLTQRILDDTGCSNDSIEFPWGTENAFFFHRGFPEPDLEAFEIIATLPKSSEMSNIASQRDKFEIWDGLAYCLQTKHEILKDGRIKEGGLEPSIESLEEFCLTRSPAGKIGLRSKRHVWPWPPWRPPPIVPWGRGGSRRWPPWRPPPHVPWGRGGSRRWPPWRPPPHVPWGR